MEPERIVDFQSANSINDIHDQDFHLMLFLLHVSNACPVVVPVNPCACHLVELLQLQAADLADLSVLRPRSRSRCTAPLPSSESSFEKA